MDSRTKRFPAAQTFPVLGDAANVIKASWSVATSSSENSTILERVACHGIKNFLSAYRINLLVIRKPVYAVDADESESTPESKFELTRREKITRDSTLREINFSMYDVYSNPSAG